MKRRATALALVMVLACEALAACGSTDTTGTASGTTEEAAAAASAVTEAAAEETTAAEAATETTESSATAEGSFPVTIQHAYGETTIESKPERVATIYDTNADPVLALGVAPVAVTSITYGKVDENGQTSWTAAAFEKLGAEVNAIDATSGIDYEAYKNADPDVILCPNSGITQEEYDQLSEIAPTIPYLETAYAITWEKQTEVTAEALGMQEEGQQLISDTKAYIQETLAAHPQLEGKTAAFCWIDPSDLSLVYVYLPIDPRAEFLEELGLSFPDELAALAQDGDFSISISKENIDVLNSVDIIVCYGDDTTLGQLQADELMNTVPAIKNGALVPISDDSDLYMGTYVTVLSIPATLDEYVGLLSDAADKVDAAE